MPDTPLTGLHYSIYPLMVRLLVVIDQSLEYVELSSGTCVATLATVPRSRNYDTCGYIPGGSENSCRGEMQPPQSGISHTQPPRTSCVPYAKSGIID